jgi:hypothetical protein
MSATMTARYAATESAHAQIHLFLERCHARGIRLRDDTGLLPEDLTPLQISALIDDYLGIDRAQLDLERAAQLQPGAECACGE